MVQCPDRIIASMDTGVDDALALAYLLGSADECELGGVIAGYGNVDADTAYANTCAVLDLFGRADIPVFLGSEHPSGAGFIYRREWINLSNTSWRQHDLIIDGD